jgi:hypothetical protein
MFEIKTSKSALNLEDDTVRELLEDLHRLGLTEEDVDDHYIEMDPYAILLDKNEGDLRIAVMTEGEVRPLYTTVWENGEWIGGCQRAWVPQILNLIGDLSLTLTEAGRQATLRWHAHAAEQLEEAEQLVRGYQMKNRFLDEMTARIVKATDHNYGTNQEDEE